MGIFDVAQSVVNSAAGIIVSDTSIDISSVTANLQTRLMAMDLGPLFGLWFQSIFVGFTMWALTICIFIIVYGRMIEIYLPLPSRRSRWRRCSNGSEGHGPELPALPVRAGISRFSHHRLRGDLRRFGKKHQREYGRQQGDLDVCGLHGAAVLYALKDRKPC